jgi:hypothetical protein
MDNRILIITGMHRSGTSLLTQWLHKCGLHVGDRLVGATIGNEDGHFEDVDFFEWHRATLREQAFPDNGFIYQPLTDLSPEQLQGLKMLLDGKNASRRQWGWKDPRTCLFLDFYRQLLPQARYLVIWRNYRSVVSSLITRIFDLIADERSHKKGLSKFIWEKIKRDRLKEQLCKEHSEDFLRIWIAYNEAIQRHLQQLPANSYLVIEHGSLAAGHEKVFQHLSAQWDFDLRYFDFRQIYKQNFISNVLDIEKYIYNEELLTQARRLERSFKEMQPAPQNSI